GSLVSAVGSPRRWQPIPNDIATKSASAIRMEFPLDHKTERWLAYSMRSRFANGIDSRLEFRLHGTDIVEQPVEGLLSRAGDRFQADAGGIGNLGQRLLGGAKVDARRGRRGAQQGIGQGREDFGRGGRRLGDRPRRLAEGGTGLG